jgi:hypothetical protein
MRTIDFSPLYRSVVGFDRLADLLDTAQADSAAGYPPYAAAKAAEIHLAATDVPVVDVRDLSSTSK